MTYPNDRPDPLADLAPNKRARQTRARMYGNKNPWLETLLWTAIGAGSVGLILVLVGANATPTWENPTAGLLASTLGGLLAGLAVLAAAGYVIARAVIWSQDN